MPTCLAVDLGGTSTRFSLITENQAVLLEQELASQHYASFDDVLTAFIAQHNVKTDDIASLCIAVAGPVAGRTASVTNLPWQIDADELSASFAINNVRLCNDFEAVAHGIACLTDEDVVTLQEGDSNLSSPRAVLGAGTGLGQAVLLPDDESWRVIATEGGHVDFAPTDRLQVLLLEHLRERFGHVSYERVLSGPGLASIYDFLRAIEQHDESPELRQAIMTGDAAAAISQYALQHQDDLASEALSLFIKIYGAQAGNLALNVIPQAGLYIAGAIAVKNLSPSYYDTFLTAFRDKGKMSALMEKIPVKLIMQTKVGLLGAQRLAIQSAL